jgi:hypothetical protein
LAGNSVLGFDFFSTAHPTNHGVERGAIDQLHGVEVYAVFFSGGVNGNDIGVVEFGGGFGLAAKAVHGLWSESQPRTEHVQSHTTVERFLPGFEDDAHAAAAEFAHDLEIAQALSGLRNHRGSHREKLPRKAYLEIVCAVEDVDSKSRWAIGGSCSEQRGAFFQDSHSPHG